MSDNSFTPHQSQPTNFYGATSPAPSSPPRTPTNFSPSQSQAPSLDGAQVRHNSDGAVPRLDPSKTLVIGGDTTEVETVPVQLVGVTYQMPQPKAGSLIEMARASKSIKENGDNSAYLDVLLDWVTSAFGPEQGEHIINRLETATDALDVHHIAELMEAVLSVQGGDNPST